MYSNTLKYNITLIIITKNKDVRITVLNKSIVSQCSITSLSCKINSIENGILDLARSVTNQKRITLTTMFQFSFAEVTSITECIWLWTCNLDMMFCYVNHNRNNRKYHTIVYTQKKLITTKLSEVVSTHLSTHTHTYIYIHT